MYGPGSHAVGLTGHAEKIALNIRSLKGPVMPTTSRSCSLAPSLSARSTSRVSRVVIAVSVTAAVAASGLIATQPAAASASGCTNALSYPVCVYAGTGKKEAGREWLGQIKGSYGGMDRGVIEVWADGYYNIAYSTNSSWFNVGKWVRTGTAVCARFTYQGQWRAGGRGPVACIAIR